MEKERCRGIGRYEVKSASDDADDDGAADAAGDAKARMGSPLSSRPGSDHPVVRTSACTRISLKVE